MKQTANKLVELLLIIFLIVLIGLGIARMVPQSVVIYFSPFGVLNMGILDLLIACLAFLIFLKANYLFARSNSSSMAILASGFLAGAIIYFQNLNFITNSICHSCKIYPPQFAPLLGELICVVSIFVAIMYPKEKMQKDKKKWLYIYLILAAILISFADRLFNTYYLNYSYKIMPNIVFMSIIIQTFYILASYSYMDIYKTQKEAVFSKFNIALLWLGIMPLFIFPAFGTTLYAIIMPIIKSLGLVLLFLGVADIEPKTIYMSFRQKFTVYLVLFLIASYIVLILMTSLFLGVRLPLYAQYAFFVFFLLVILMQYIASERFIKPIVDITETMSTYSPEAKPKNIPITSNDEIGELASKINSITTLNWNYFERLIEINNRETILKNIIQIIRSSLDINEVLGTMSSEVAKLFNVQRVSIVERSRNIYSDSYSIINEYKADLGLKGLRDLKPPYGLGLYYAKRMEKNGVFSIDSVQDDSFPEKYREYYTKLGVKSIIMASIQREGDVWGGLVISDYNTSRYWTGYDKELIKVIANQMYIAIRQSELYEFQKQTAENESILRGVISEIKLTRDLKQAYRILLQSLAKIFGISRVLFLESSIINTEDIKIKYEYIAPNDIFVEPNCPFPQVCVEEFLKLIHELQTYVINDISQCNYRLKPYYFENCNIQSLLAVPLVKVNNDTKILGFLVLCSDEKRNWTPQEIQLLNSISDSVVSVIWEITSFIEIEELRNSFVSALAHDFQVPLLAEQKVLEFLVRNSEENVDILVEMLANNKSIVTLLNKFLDIYNYESKKKMLEYDEVDFLELVHSSVQELKTYANEKSVIIDIIHEKAFKITVDSKEIKKVLNTLIENAIDHSKPQSKVSIFCDKSEAKILFSVHNIGKPIPLETQKKLFNRYEMAVEIERKIGAGVGLFLAKRVIEAHGGNIWIESEENKGTTFFISIPLSLN